MTDATAESGPAEGCNEVVLQGRVSAAAEERVLPSGDAVWTFRVVVPRGDQRGRATIDTIDCAVWAGRARRTVAGLAAGDQVSVTGALRRRFFRAGGATVSRVEVEVATLRVLRKAVAKGGVTRRAASA